MSSPLRKIAAAVGIAAAAAFIATGCGGDSKSTKSGDKGKESYGDLVINIGDETEAGVFDPAQTSYFDSVNRNNALFATLYRFTPDGSEMVPDLAAELPEISKDGLTYTVKLRDDAKWSDGEKITADDVVYAIHHALDPETQSYFASFMLDIVGACELNSGKNAKKNCPDRDLTDGKAESVGVKAMDDTTVVFQLVREVPWFDQLMQLQTFSPLRKDVIEKHGKDWTKPENIVTSGAFTLKSYKPKSEIVVERNKEYYRADDVKLNTITFRMIGEPKTALREFERGRIDMAFPRTSIDAADIERVKTEDYYVSQTSTETQYMYMNTRNAALAEPKVRQALSLAIDRPSIVENITKRGDKPMNTVTPSGIPGYDIYSEGAKKFIGAEDGPDLDKAKELLEEGNWDESTTLNMVFSSDSGAAQSTAEQIQSDLRKIGVKVKLSPTSGDVLSSVGFGISPIDSKVDMLLQGWVADYPDAQNYYQLFTCANVDNGLNSANFCDKDYDKLYETALTTVDEDARFEVYKQLEARLTGPDGLMPAAPLFQPTLDTIVATYVKLDGKAFELSTSGLMYYENITVEKDKDKK